MLRDEPPAISVIIPVGSRFDDVTEMYGEYRAALNGICSNWEVIFVVDGPHPPQYSAALKKLISDREPVTVINLSRVFGEATAIMAGFEQCRGQTIMTLPAYHQVDASDLGKLVQGLETADLCVARRWPRIETTASKLRRSSFHKLVAVVTSMPLRDLGCGVRVMRRKVLEELSLYGDQHRFIALLADRQGFQVREIDLRQSPKDNFTGVYRPKEYTHLALDIFTVFFLVRFTKKPLRFFGMIGVSTFAIGLLLVLILTVQRLAFAQPLADRPALLLSSLLIVLGLQIFALGLLGELIIFTHAKNIKDYQVDRVIEFQPETITQSLPSPTRVAS